MKYGGSTYLIAGVPHFAEATFGACFGVVCCNEGKWKGLVIFWFRWLIPLLWKPSFSSYYWRILDGNIFFTGQVLGALFINSLFSAFILGVDFCFSSWIFMILKYNSPIWILPTMGKTISSQHAYRLLLLNKRLPLGHVRFVTGINTNHIDDFFPPKISYLLTFF